MLPSGKDIMHTLLDIVFVNFEMSEWSRHFFYFYYRVTHDNRITDIHMVVLFILVVLFLRFAIFRPDSYDFYRGYFETSFELLSDSSVLHDNEFQVDLEKYVQVASCTL